MAKRRPDLETKYQTGLKERLRTRFPGCYIFKNDERDQQGIPDLTILFPGGGWAVLEVKAETPTGPDSFEPNQEWFIDQFNQMYFSSVIHPENEAEVLDALQQALSAG